MVKLAKTYKNLNNIQYFVKVYIYLKPHLNVNRRLLSCLFRALFQIISIDSMNVIVIYVSESRTNAVNRV